MERKHVRLVPPGDVLDFLHFDLADCFVLKNKKIIIVYRLLIII